MAATSVLEPSAFSSHAFWCRAGRALNASGVDLFCRVVDHFGDAGVCFRLAHQLSVEFGREVRLFIDLPETLAALMPAEHPVQVLHWEDACAAAPAPLVIATFCCRLPESYIAKMRSQTERPIWVNVEYLSAETWVESHHLLPSMRPDGLVETFFYPGFTANTGGLLREKSLNLGDLPAKSASFAQQVLGTDYRVNLFCYETPMIDALVAAMNDVGVPVCIRLPIGVLANTLGERPAPRGCVRFERSPFVSQPEFDAVLASADFNIVRGEDSFVRAQWAGKPFLWHIYEQSENTHLTKLHAWLARFQPSVATAHWWGDVSSFFHAWNARDAAIVRAVWPNVFARRAMWAHACEKWRAHLLLQTDLATNLVCFAQEQQSALK